MEILSDASKEEILRIAKAMWLETYNEKDTYFCVKGINGHATTIHYGAGAMAELGQHLIQMGRDQLKMELNGLLDITKHK
jgi:hypothetical protein